MFEYIVGKINYTNSNYVILENNFIGYKIYVSDPNKFELNKFQKIFLYSKIYQNLKNTFSYEYYGFKTLNEKIFFEQLLQINGIGVKSALAILKNDINLIKQLIKNQDINSLTSLEGFNNKIATHVVGQLSYKIKLEKQDVASSDSGEIVADIISALKALGYGKTEIEKAMVSIETEISKSSYEDISNLISLAIQSIIKNENLSN